MGTHPIFESDFDCLTEINKFEELKIAQSGTLLFQNKFYIFFKNKNDAEDAVNRGFRFEHKDYNAKQISIPDCIGELREILGEEKHKAERYGETFTYPEIFELNKIRIKWDERKVQNNTQNQERKRKLSEGLSDKEFDGPFQNIRISVSQKSDLNKPPERIAECKVINEEEK